MSKREITQLVALISKATRKFEKKEKKKQDEMIKPRNLYKLLWNASASADASTYDAYFIQEVMRVVSELLADFITAKDIEAKQYIHYQLMRVVNDPVIEFEPELTDAAVGFWYLGP